MLQPLNQLGNQKVFEQFLGPKRKKKFLLYAGLPWILLSLSTPWWWGPTARTTARSIQLNYQARAQDALAGHSTNSLHVIER